MANWITLKQLSEKRGIAESDLRTWETWDISLHRG